MNINKETLLDMSVSKIISEYPFMVSFLENHSLNIEANDKRTLSTYLSSLDSEELEDKALDTEILVNQMVEFIEQMLGFLGSNENRVESLTIIAGQDKSGDKETFGSFKVKAGEIICIVGPTGSGKSRLLADIEWAAEGDTPTKRKILINDAKPDKKWRFSISEKLVAQLSQNMNFVMDLTVYEFLELHAISRLVENRDEVIKKIIEAANHLAGEKFSSDTAITSLSGGQSRSLMVADVAILSNSPIILIDEIENAGIDRKKALNLLLDEGKIVLMATHDPILALMGNKRIIIKNGGIAKIIEVSQDEREILADLEKLDKKLLLMRNKLRNGEILNA